MYIDTCSISCTHPFLTLQLSHTDDGHCLSQAFIASKMPVELQEMAARSALESHVESWAYQPRKPIMAQNGNNLNDLEFLDLDM